MKKLFVFLPLILVFAGCSSTQSTPAQAAITLAQNNQTLYVIALAADAIPAEKTAANELQKYLQQVTGAEFSIQPETAVNSDTPQILVGAGSRVKVLLPHQDWESLGSDGIVIKTVGKNVILAGGRSRGTLYAVYSFLEDQIGVRWWTPSATFVPQRKSLQIASQDITYTPQIRVREAYYDSVRTDPLFATRLKINGHYQTQGAELGGHNSILGFVHTFDRLLPPERYFAEHPEWYSDVDNGGLPCTSKSKMPLPQKSQLCLTNEAARLELTKNALEWIRKNPEAGMISISQNDNQNKCNAPADLAIEKHEGSPAGPLLHFVNAVAADIEKEYPGFLVETLAYQYTEKAPLHVRPRSNVVIRLCSFGVDVSQPLENDAKFSEAIREWKKITPRLYVWNYVTNFANVVFPHPNMRPLGKDIRYLAANNTIGLFEQGDSYSKGTGDFVALRTWLLSHLMWDPSLDQNKLEDEFLKGYYGAAAPHLRVYLDAMQEAFAVSGLQLSHSQSNYSWLTLEVMNSATDSFRQAEAVVANDATLLERVRREKVALDHAWILRYFDLKKEAEKQHAQFEGPKDINQALDDFISEAKKFKIAFYREGGSFESYIPILKTRIKNASIPSAPLPQFAQGKPENDVIDAQEGDFHLYSNGVLVNVVDDLQASNKRAAKMVGNTDAWAVQYKFSQSAEFLKNGPWHCYAFVRVQVKTGVQSGAAFTTGIYDVKNKTIITRLNKNVEQLEDGEYQAIDLGVHDLHPEMYLFVAPPNREDIESVSVDRFILVRESAQNPQQ